MHSTYTTRQKFGNNEFVSWDLKNLKIKAYALKCLNLYKNKFLFTTRSHLLIKVNYTCVHELTINTVLLHTSTQCNEY